LRKKRLDLKLLQRDVAKRLGANETTIYNWEKNRSNPSLQFIPKIIRFLGYFPLKCHEDTIGRLRFYKLVNGFSYKRLGKLMGKHPEQLADWLSGRVRPCKRNMESIINFLAEVYRATVF
jgi:transcriptional regulator with XRE-family HTH domain